jgi:putative polyhydroxyalkanoate system protein
MSQPVVVSIPHRLGKEEARERIKSGFGRAQGFGGLNILEQTWNGDRLEFRAGALGQTASGSVDVGDDHVRIEVQLPWLLAQLAEKAKALMQKQGQILLEKK